MLVPLVALLAFALAACGGAEGTSGEGSLEGEPPSVVATHSIIGDIVQNVAGEDFPMEMMVGAGEDPHVFEPAPADSATLSEADIVFENGLEFEPWIDDMFESSGSDAQRVALSEGIEPRESDHDHGDHEGEDHADEHGDDHGDEHSHEGEGHAHENGEHGDEHSHEGEDHAHEGEEHSDEAHADDHGGEVSCHGEGDDFHCDGLPEGATCELGDDGEITCDGLPEGASCHETEEDFHCHGLEEEGHGDDEHGDEAHADEHGDEHSHESEDHGAEHADEAHADGHGDHGHEHGEFDPHIYFDPEQGATMTENVRDALVEADPDNADMYRENASAYIAELRETDEWISEQVESVPEENRMLVTTHDAFGYFTDKYGFEVPGVAIESFTTEAADPAAGDIAELSDEIRSLGVPAIFPETTSNDAVMRQIADEAGVELADPIYSDALGEEGTGADTYIGMLRHNTTTIVDALA